MGVIFKVGLTVQIKPLIQVIRNRYFCRFKYSSGIIVFIHSSSQCLFSFLLGSSYEVIKIDGEERFIEWDIEEGGTYQEVPKWLFPVRTAVDFLDMDAGDGRNQALFNYILTLTSNDFSVDDTRECIRILNRFVLKEPLSDDELEVILRDEAFQKPVFFCDKTFLFDRFATWLKNNENVVSISNQLHIYQDGIYQVGYKAIETAMINQIPNLKKTQRREVLEYMELIADEKAQADDPEASAGIDKFYTKQGKVLHPNGLSLAVDQIAKESPTYAELGKSANYSLKFNTKNVKMGLIKSKVGTAVV